MDWQTLGPYHPAVDVVSLFTTCLNMEKLENWTEQLIDSYFETFEKTCFQFKIDMPFDKEHFLNAFYDHSFVFRILYWKSMDSSIDPQSKMYQCLLKYCQFLENSPGAKVSTILQEYQQITFETFASQTETK